MACCGCFKRCKPRYKRHVDSIFPPNPEDGIVTSNMEKLTFYSLSAPEKLDRIGHYLAQRLSRDIQRNRSGWATPFFFICGRWSSARYSGVLVLSKLLVPSVLLWLHPSPESYPYFRIKKVANATHNLRIDFIHNFSKLCWKYKGTVLIHEVRLHLTIQSWPKPSSLAVQVCKCLHQSIQAT